MFRVLLLFNGIVKGLSRVVFFIIYIFVVIVFIIELFFVDVVFIVIEEMRWRIGFGGIVLVFIRFRDVVSVFIIFLVFRDVGIVCLVLKFIWVVYIRRFGC